MRVRVLSEWPGSQACGTVCDVPDAEALVRIQFGWAEPVEAPLEQAIVATPVETAVSPKRPRRAK